MSFQPFPKEMSKKTNFTFKPKLVAQSSYKSLKQKAKNLKHNIKDRKRSPFIALKEQRVETETKTKETEPDTLNPDMSFQEDMSPNQ